MVLGIFLGEEEGFVVTSLIVYVGDVRTSVPAIIATGGEDEPAAIAAPAMEGFGFWAIGLGEWTNGGGGIGGVEVHQIEIGFLVPYVELSERSDCEDEPTAIGADTGNGDGTAMVLCSEDEAWL